MVLRTTERFTYPNGQARKFFGCVRFPDCHGAHGAHPDGTPMGTPADKRTRIARVNAHAAFDAAAKARGMSRKDSYRWLQDLTDLDRLHAHISMFDAETCERLVAVIAVSEAVRLCAAEITEATR